MVPLLLGLATIVALLTLAGLFARRDPDVHTLMFRIEALPHGLRGRLGVWIARDREASALVRFLPLTAFVYWVTPLDLIPDFIPGIGFFDDRLVLALALWCVGRVSRGSLEAHLARVEFIRDAALEAARDESTEAQAPPAAPGPDPLESPANV